MMVSIIIPVYNAAKTLDRCWESVKNQTSKKIEVVFVDDCSTDSSYEKLQSYSQGSTIEIQIVHHDSNCGVAAARNTGLEVARGEYVLFVDADDWISSDAIEVATSKAVESGLDIVGFDWYLVHGERKRPMTQPDFNTPLEALTSMMRGTMKWNLWLYMVRRSLYEGVRFVPGQDMGEDMLVMHRLFLKSDTVGVVHKRLYNYAEPVFSKSFNDILIAQVSENVGQLEYFIRESEYSEKLLPLLPMLKLNIKLPLLISANIGQYKRWSEWWPEVNAEIMGNTSQSLRTRLLQWCAAKKLWVIIQLYYWVAICFLYKILYK